MKVICPSKRSGQPWKPKPHLSLMAIERTGGGLAGKRAWRQVADIRTLILAGGKCNVYCLSTLYWALDWAQSLWASQWLSELGTHFAGGKIEDQIMKSFAQGKV